MICAVCCGTKREVEINCPRDCSYLTSSRSHPPAVQQRRQERDFGFLLPLVTDFTESQHQLLLFLQAMLLRHAATAVPPVLDPDVAEGAAAAAATLETSHKGIIYEHQAVSVPAQRLSSEFGRVIAELGKNAGAQSARLEREAAVALRCIEKAARTAAGALPGDEPPVYLKLLGRVLKDAGDRAAASEQQPDPPSTGLIIPS
jgi:hypothetical protein